MRPRLSAYAQDVSDYIRCVIGHAETIAGILLLIGLVVLGAFTTFDIPIPAQVAIGVIAILAGSYHAFHDARIRLRRYEQSLSVRAQFAAEPFVQQPLHHLQGFEAPIAFELRAVGGSVVRTESIRVRIHSVKFQPRRLGLPLRRTLIRQEIAQATCLSPEFEAERLLDATGAPWVEVRRFEFHHADGVSFEGMLTFDFEVTTVLPNGGIYRAPILPSNPDVKRERQPQAIQAPLIPERMEIAEASAVPWAAEIVVEAQAAGFEAYLRVHNEGPAIRLTSQVEIVSGPYRVEPIYRAPWLETREASIHLGHGGAATLHVARGMVREKTKGLPGLGLLLATMGTIKLMSIDRPAGEFEVTAFQNRLLLRISLMADDGDRMWGPRDYEITTFEFALAMDDKYESWMVGIKDMEAAPAE